MLIRGISYVLEKNSLNLRPVDIVLPVANAQKTKVSYNDKTNDIRKIPDRTRSFRSSGIRKVVTVVKQSNYAR